MRKRAAERIRTILHDTGPSASCLSLVTCHLLLVTCLLLVASCGYRMVGSTPLPFNSVTIKPVQNRTYEPRLEEKLYNALAYEFIHQGIEVKNSGGEVGLEAVIRTFQLGAIGSVDEMVKEQAIIMQVDIKLTDGETVTEFRQMESPIKITFETEGAVSDSVAHKEISAEKACKEIATELVGRIILKYAK